VALPAVTSTERLLTTQYFGRLGACTFRHPQDLDRLP
jgi:hypothetical protein